MLKVDIIIKKYLNERYGAELLSNEEGKKYIDEKETLLYHFHFPYNNKRKLIIAGDNDFPDLRLLIIRNNQDVFIRICQGEARGLLWAEVQVICHLIKKSDLIEL